MIAIFLDFFPLILTLCAAIRFNINFTRSFLVIALYSEIAVWARLYNNRYKLTYFEAI